jgi:hypothetical protein
MRRRMGGKRKGKGIEEIMCSSTVYAIRVLTTSYYLKLVSHNDCYLLQLLELEISFYNLSLDLKISQNSSSLSSRSPKWIVLLRRLSNKTRH